MKIEVRPTLDALENNLCKIEVATIRTIHESLKMVSFEISPDATAPKIVSGWIKNFAREYGWIESFRINPEIPKDLPITNYLMDGILDHYEA